jgi:hypothetical protein
MTKLSKSPNRNTFQKNNYIKRAIEKGKSMTDPTVKSMIDWYESWDKLDLEHESDPTWKKNNMEWDLRTTDWILKKVRNSDNYAQNLYAAICNNDFIKEDVIQILKENYWSASWRSAGGIISNMRQEGDYIDWYCSGIGSQEDGYGLDGYIPELDEDKREYVPESVVTDEIRKDLLKLGWIVVDNLRQLIKEIYETR